MYSAYITTLRDLRKHSNADRLQVVTVFGNSVIVDFSYCEGQKVVFFPVDGQLSEKFANDNNLVRVKDEDGNSSGGYLDPDKRNITALKLRGEKSEGLVLPVETLSTYVDVNTLKEGDQITVLDGQEICRKYIPKSNVKAKTTSKNGKQIKKKQKETISYPLFIEHSDTSQLAFAQRAFKPGDTCYITLKLHGTSARTANTVEVTKKKRNLFLKKVFKVKDKEVKRFTCVSGTRRTVLRDQQGDGYYGRGNLFRQLYHDMFKEKLPKGMEVYYEIVGWDSVDHTIMGICSNRRVKDKEFSKQYGKETIFSYGCDQGQNDCYVYRMTMMNEDGYMVELSWEQVQIECEKMGVKCVPTFEKLIYTDWDDLMQRVEQYYDGADPIGQTHIREGIVVRIDNREKFTAYKHKNFSFKYLEGIIKDSADAPDMEEAEELFLEKQVTNGQ